MPSRFDNGGMSSVPTSLTLGPLRVETPVVLAPMAGITNAAYRRLCAEQGAGLYVSEMITSRGLVEGDETTQKMLVFDELETVRSVQLYGTDPVYIGKAVEILCADHGVAHVDLNFGCPVPKVTRKGGGGALPWKRGLLGEILTAAVAAAAPYDVPVTMKTRKGLDDDHLTYLDAGRQLGDGVPVGLAGVGLLDGAAVQRDRRDARLLGDAAGVEVGEVLVVEALAGLHRHGHVVRRGGRDRRLEDVGEQAALPRQRATAALAGHLGDRAAEVEVDVCDAVLLAQDLHGPADVVWVGAVELDGTDGLELVEDQHLARRLVALDEAARGDHLADVESGPLLRAEPAVGRVGDPGHRREDHGGVDGDRPAAR